MLEYYIIIMTLETCMSDGPHRSLPMRRHWKDLAQRAANSAYAPEEVTRAFSVALKRDFRDVPLSQVRDIFGGGEQSSMFQEDWESQLEAARRTCRGSAPGNTLIDCAIEANAKGLTGDAAFVPALENALDTYARAGCHQIEEHCHRKEQRSTANVRDRLREARNQCAYKVLANELISGNEAGSRDLRLRKHSGVDEGPPL